MATPALTFTIPIRKITVATDFSACSKTALRSAASIARQYGASIQLVHVLSPWSYVGSPEVLPGAMDMAQADAEKQIKLLEAAGALTGVRHTTLIDSGSPADMVVRTAELDRADLIVIGTHGRTGLKKLCLGSVAEAIFRHAKCPVLTVGPQAEINDKAIAEGYCIVVPSDFSSKSALAAMYATSLAKQHEGEVVVMHVLDRLRGEAVYDAPRVMHYLQDRLRACVEHRGPVPGKLSIVIERGKPSDKILEVASAKRAQMIVLGVRSSRITDRIMWATAYDVVSRARCPVLTVRVPDSEKDSENELAEEPKQASPAEKKED